MRLSFCPALLVLLVAACASREPPVSVPAERGALSGMACLAALAEAGGVAADFGVERSGTCGVDTPVSLLSAGAVLEPPLATSCAMAVAWARFVPEIDRLAREHLGKSIRLVRHYGSHACRRMTGDSRRLSLHATARAVDVAGFALADGSEVMVGRDWSGNGPRARFLRAMARAGCRHFAVVLTPDFDRHHRDHLHFDIGPWQLCGL